MTEARFFQHGWQSWSVTGWRPVGGAVRLPTQLEHRIQAIDQRRLDVTELNGSGFGAIETADETEFLGALGVDGWVTVEDGQLRAHGPSHLEWYRATGPFEDTAAHYAKLLGDRLGHQRSSVGPVWCSWYAFGPDISADGIHTVLDDLGDLPFDVVQIDDGWQRTIGDWMPGSTFPRGMRHTADRITATGRKAGLWLAPFLVDPTSETARSYPDMLLRDAEGQPAIVAHNWGPTFALDVRREDALDFVSHTIDRSVGEWGYSYLKLDFLYAGAMVEADNAESIYRKALQRIADAAPQAYILACGAPVIASIGVADGIRVGPDTATFWDDIDRTIGQRDRSGPGAADAIASSLNRLSLSSVIDTDPDVVFFRSLNNSLTVTERQLLVDLAHVCDFKAVSDPPAWLSPTERAALSAFLSTDADVHQIGRHEFDVDGRRVDFSAVLEARPW